MSGRINAKVRSYNYKIAAHENKTYKALVDQSKRELARAQEAAKQAEDSAELSKEEAEGFQVLAEKAGLLTTFTYLTQKVPIPTTITTNTLAFKDGDEEDNKQKELEVVEASMSYSENKYAISFTFDKPVEIINTDDDKTVATVDGFEISNLSISAATSSDAKTLGDCTKCVNLDTVALKTSDLWIKQFGTEDASLGSGSKTSAIFVLDGFDASNHTISVSLKSSQTVEVQPIPGKAQETP